MCREATKGKNSFGEFVNDTIWYKQKKGLKMVKFLENRKISINEAGKNEAWIHKWIKEDPGRLGLGNFDILNEEVRQVKNGGGRLDMLGYNRSSNTYYEIEIMLGECDSDHGFRTLDYWAREKVKNPDASHFAVLVAENLQGRYKTLIEILPQYLPFIAIEIQTLKMVNNNEEFITCRAEIIAQPDEIITKNLSESESIKDEQWWRQNEDDDYVNLCNEIYECLKKDLSEIRIDYTVKSYISIKKGRRVFMYINSRKNGCYISLPDDGTGTANEPSKRYEEWKTKLSSINIDLNWDMKNSSFSPISLNLPRAKTKEALVIDLLKDSYELL
jgi:hypothetical protein